MVTLKHTFVSGKADGSDNTLVKPTDWNAEHKFETSAASVYLGRDATGPGPVQELPVSSVFPSGVIIVWAGVGGGEPAGWYLCDGTVRPVGDSSALAAILGSIYGGNGVTTFGVPDLRGRVIAHVDGSAGILKPENSPFADTVGGKIGEEMHLLAETEMPAHAHVAHDTGHTHDLAPGRQVAYAAGPNTDLYSFQIGTTPSDLTKTEIKAATITTDGKGGGAAHYNVQPTMMMHYIIKR